jgi:hypothetical protein
MPRNPDISDLAAVGSLVVSDLLLRRKYDVGLRDALEAAQEAAESASGKDIEITCPSTDKQLHLPHDASGYGTVGDAAAARVSECRHCGKPHVVVEDQADASLVHVINDR